MQQWLSSVWSAIIGFIATLEITDLLDILIVGFLIYKAIHLLRETRAVQLVKGIVIFALAYALARILRLDTLSFLLNIVVNYGVIALIIVFQPELRSMLEKMGRNKFFSKIIRGDVSKDDLTDNRAALGQIVRAVMTMSRSRTGALIVFEMETMLGDIINTGTVVNADVGQDLIRNIFFNKAPLHDGAMIIRRFRIHAAGCFLPLSQNHDISRDLGTRHRAALGISENSDALALVVSEETGTISLMHNGQMTRDLSEEDLTIVLEQYLLSADETVKPVSIKSLLGRNSRFNIGKSSDKSDGKDGDPRNHG